LPVARLYPAEDSAQHWQRAAALAGGGHNLGGKYPGADQGAVPDVPAVKKQAEADGPTATDRTELPAPDRCPRPGDQPCDERPAGCQADPTAGHQPQQPAGGTITADAYLMAGMDLQAFPAWWPDYSPPHDVRPTPTLAAPPPPVGALASTPGDPWRPARADGPFVASPAIVANITGGP